MRPCMLRDRIYSILPGYDGTSPEPVMDIQANGRGGIDNGRYPTPRTVLFGLQLSF